MTLAVGRAGKVVYVDDAGKYTTQPAPAVAAEPVSEPSPTLTGQAVNDQREVRVPDPEPQPTLLERFWNWLLGRN